MLTAIIVAAGSSHRMGFDKLFQSLAGKPVVAHSIDAFEQTASVIEIILVARQDQLPAHEKMISEQKFCKVRRIIPGGERRQDSVRAGLEALDKNVRFVAVHDAARPLVRPKQIEEVFVACQKHGAAALAEPVRDTLKRVSKDGFITDSVAREHMYALQTPQVFARGLLERAYDAIFGQGTIVTDETSALHQIGQKVAIVSNSEFNFKITYPTDLALAELVLGRRQEAQPNEK
jgi:2-C-methyl-D-erythritol 4-phosphate cytidylyltransferase